VGGNVLIARTLARRHGYRVYGELIEFPLLERFAHLFERLIALGVVLVAWAAGEWSSGYAFNYLSARHAVALGQTDPLFGIDLSFYLFKLPFISFAYSWLIVVIIASLVATVLVYRAILRAFRRRQGAPDGAGSLLLLRARLPGAALDV